VNRILPGLLAGAGWVVEFELSVVVCTVPLVG
jgi:hypothetical protein